MKISSIILAALLIGCTVQPKPEPTPGKGTIRFWAVVSAIRPLEGNGLIFVHFDPHFTLSLRIVSASQPSVQFEAGHVVEFAIHSPTKLFAEDSQHVIGKQFEFLFSYPTSNRGIGKLEVVTRNKH